MYKNCCNDFYHNLCHMVKHETRKNENYKIHCQQVESFDAWVNMKT